jgi:hypothetical protein
MIQYSGSAQTFNSNREVFTSDELKAAGILNLTDVYRLSVRWDRTSIDGYNFRGAAGAQSVYQKQKFSVLINDQKTDIQYLDEQNVDLLPFTIDIIDSVIIIYSPELYKGEYTNNGIINFILKKPADGLSVNALQSIGNEVGDPGPYIYTEYDSPNVDKLGYTAGINFTSKGKEWFIAGSFKFNENFITDPAVIDRINAVSWSNKTNLLGASAILGLSKFSGEHKLLFNYTESDGYYFSRQFGNEVPGKRIYKHIGFDGNFEVNPQIRINYYIKTGANSLLSRDDKLDLTYQLEVNSTLGRIDAVYSGKSFTANAGISYSNKEGRRSDIQYNETYDFLKLFGSVNFGLSGSTEQQLMFHTTKNYNNYALNARLVNIWNINNNNSLYSSLSYSENLFNENSDYWSWSQNGNPVTTPEFNSIIVSDISSKAKSLDAGAAYRYSPSPAFQFEAGVNFIATKNDYMEVPVYTYDKDKSLFNTMMYLVNNQNYNVVNFYSDIEHRISNLFSHIFKYSYQSILDGSSGMMDIWNEFPEHKFYYSILMQPSETFSILAALRYTSPTEWHEYRYVSPQSFNRYNNKIDHRLVADLSMQKWFWSRKIWINLMFNNIFNQEEYYHPVGASLDFRMYLQIHIYLQSILG